jgi:hypothetical protein
MNLVIPVLSLLLWQTSATPGTESTWPADFSAAFSGGGFHQSQSYDGWQAGGGVGANWYLRRPLLDDGTPLSIQAFLQRLDRLSFSVDAVGFDGIQVASGKQATASPDRTRSSGPHPAELARPIQGVPLAFPCRPLWAEGDQWLVAGYAEEYAFSYDRSYYRIHAQGFAEGRGSFGPTAWGSESQCAHRGGSADASGPISFPGRGRVVGRLLRCAVAG